MGDVVPLHRYNNEHKMKNKALNILQQIGFLQNKPTAVFTSKERPNIVSVSNSSSFDRHSSPEAAAQTIRKSFEGTTDDLAFPVVEYARSLGIDVFVDDLKKISDIYYSNIKGYLALKKNGKKPVIAVSVEESYGHQRWTVAHELWHYFSHRNDLIDSTVFYTEFGNYQSQQKDSEEDRANRFAAELLMPQEEFKSMYDWYMKTSKDRLLQKLSECFKVSEKAVLLRIQNLGL